MTERTIAASRLPALDVAALAGALDAHGYGLIEGLLDRATCAELIRIYDDPGRFRRKVVMSRHGYGRGEYQYFAYPLPGPVAALRQVLYPTLAGIANRWNQSLGIEIRYPDTHAAFLERCRAVGQAKPTPLLLRYGPGDYNCLHQDIYGACLFPLQVAVLLSEPGRDFSGGEFLLYTQQPRRQSWAEVVPLTMGGAVVFPVNLRPVPGARGPVRAGMRHGVSRVRSGSRHTLGLIFHDAEK